MDLSASPATYALILVNVALSIYGISVNQDFTRRFAFNVEAVACDREHFRIFTSSFLHGDYFHLLFNMMTLLFFGPVIERILGADGFLVVYFGAVMVSGIVSFYIHRTRPHYTSLGASDGVAGIVLAFCVFFPLHGIYFFFIPIPIPAVLFGILFVAISAGLMGRARNHIAHEAHLAGAIAGIVLTIAQRPDIISNLIA